MHSVGNDMGQNIAATNPTTKIVGVHFSGFLRGCLMNIKNILR